MARYRRTTFAGPVSSRPREAGRTSGRGAGVDRVVTQHPALLTKTPQTDGARVTSQLAIKGRPYANSKQAGGFVCRGHGARGERTGVVAGGRGGRSTKDALRLPRGEKIRSAAKPGRGDPGRAPLRLPLGPGGCEPGHRR